MKNWNLRECNIDDLKKVTNFLNKNFSIKDKDFFWKQENIKLKIFNSPIGVGSFIYGITEDDKVIGTASLTIKRLVYNNKEIKIAEIGDTFTAQSKTYIDKNSYEKFKCLNDKNLNHIHDEKKLLFINKSIFGRLVEELKIKAKNRDIDLIYGTANSNSSSSYLNRLGFIKANKDEVNEYFLITTKLIEQRFVQFKKISFFMNLSLNMIYNLYLNVLVNHNKLNIKCVNDIQHERDLIDNFWYEYQFKSGTIVRDYNYIKWRYFSDKNYKMYFLYKKEKLISWIILKEKNLNKFKKITICDFLYSCSKKEFLFFFYKVLKKNDYQNCIINFWSNTNQDIFKNISFYKNKKINLIYYFTNKDLKKNFDSIKNFTIGCSDNI
jgi:hypothetical protein